MATVLVVYLLFRRLQNPYYPFRHDPRIASVKILANADTLIQDDVKTDNQSERGFKRDFNADCWTHIRNNEIKEESEKQANK